MRPSTNFRKFLIDRKRQNDYNVCIMFEKLTLEEYNKILSAKSPTPGGGSALAVVGTIACSLAEMSVNVTLTKLAETDEQYGYLQRCATLFAHARKRLSQLSDEDAEAFRNIIECNHLPQDTDEQKIHRENQRQKAYHKAALVPLEVMRVCREALTVAENRTYPFLYKYVASDCKIGMDLFANIIENSMENVYANTTLIKDSRLRATLEKQGEEIVQSLKR